MQGRLEGKVIVVAGAGGIGDGLARRYAAEGAAVVLGDLDTAGAARVAESIAASGGRAVAMPLDGGDDASVKALVGRALSEFGGLDGFHANYACFPEAGEDVLDLAMDDYDQAMHVNARGFVLCTRHALPPMLARGGGALLYTSSGAAYMGEPMRLAYAMSKLAIHALMRHVARRFGRQGIRANVISPGVILHERMAAMVPPEVVAAFEEATLTGTLGGPDDIAAMGALLLSDEGRYITGQVIGVDGGMPLRP